MHIFKLTTLLNSKQLAIQLFFLAGGNIATHNDNTNCNSLPIVTNYNSAFHLCCKALINNTVKKVGYNMVFPVAY